MRKLLTAALLFTCTIAFAPDATAQQGLTKKDYDLAKDLGLSFMKAKLTIGGEQGGSLSKATAKYKNFYQFCAVRGISNANFLTINVGPACHMEAVLRGQKTGYPLSGRVHSGNGVQWPSGDYDVNFPVICDEGHYRGVGVDYSGTISTTEMSTTLRLNRATWRGTMWDVINIMQTSTWGMDGDTSYVEGMLVENFRIVGDNSGWYDVGYTANGFGGWELGEQSQVTRLYCWNNNGYGIANVRGTPAHYIDCSVFANALGGVGLIGCDQNTILLDMLSGDDNPALVVQISGYTRPSGGNLTVTLGKSETGRRSPHKGQILLWQRSPTWGIINFKSQQAVYADKVDAAFVMNTLAASGGQILHAQFVSWNCNTVLQDLRNHERFANVDYRPYEFTWSDRAGNAGIFVDMTTGTQVTATTDNSTDRLGVVANVATYNYTAGTPLYSITGP